MSKEIHPPIFPPFLLNTHLTSKLKSPRASKSFSFSSFLSFPSVRREEVQVSKKGPAAVLSLTRPSRDEENAQAVHRIREIPPFFLFFPLFLVPVARNGQDDSWKSCSKVFFFLSFPPLVTRARAVAMKTSLPRFFSFFLFRRIDLEDRLGRRDRRGPSLSFPFFFFPFPTALSVSRSDESTFPPLPFFPFRDSLVVFGLDSSLASSSGLPFFFPFLPSRRACWSQHAVDLRFSSVRGGFEAAPVFFLPFFSFSYIIFRLRPCLGRCFSRFSFPLLCLLEHRAEHVKILP